MRTRIAAIALVTGIVILLAACGGGADTGTGNSADAPPTATSSSTKDHATMLTDGETVYIATCSACHGPDATGLENLGKDLTTSAFLTDMSEDEFIEFMKMGRPIGDPLNTTGIDMPPRGGNPAMSDQDMLDVLAYLRSLQP